ncbi:hypothetical protein R3Q06_35705 [Rhodococcus erythropolis]|uniref:hypothetical protein n=1 Tax=Rhodococcus erythropolis TaxID=1833 RepID=UPI002949D71B|nr:hypothetical protein [Rhodococcus erythropolis]MDV6278718.1 hypothetical protein [Rhodococcus erythropolis]
MSGYAGPLFGPSNWVVILGTVEHAVPPDTPRVREMVQVAETSDLRLDLAVGRARTSSHTAPAPRLLINPRSAFDSTSSATESADGATLHIAASSSIVTISLNATAVPVTTAPLSRPIR